MQQFKPEFGNSEHIKIIEEEIKRQKIEEILEEYPEDIVPIKEYEDLKTQFKNQVNNFLDCFREFEDGFGKLKSKADDLFDLIN